jgi:death-on-curing family protein
LKNLTTDELIKIHQRVQDRFKTTPGIKNQSLIASIVERPDTRIRETVCFPDIYTKAAALMETMRWHAFIDGNKRSLLLATQYYLKLNDYYFLVPIHSVRFTVDIADTQGEEQEVTDNLIATISAWLKNYVARTDDIEGKNAIINRVNTELQEIRNLIVHDPKKAVSSMDHWLAIDVYPEYREDAEKALKFIGEMNFEILHK